jgi:hypothetical protein
MTTEEQNEINRMRGQMDDVQQNLTMNHLMSYRLIIQDLIRVVVDLQQKVGDSPDSDVENFIKDLIDAGYGPANYR